MLKDLISFLALFGMDLVDLFMILNNTFILWCFVGKPLLDHWNAGDKAQTETSRV